MRDQSLPNIKRLVSKSESKLPLRNLRPLLLCVALGTLALSGCHDGPLYALKTVNPYFTMKEWREDDQLGVTDHERRNELIALTKKIGSMPANRQLFWAGHLSQLYEKDPSSEMRRLAINAAGKLRHGPAIALIEKGLKDDNLKVRMEACRALSRRGEPRAIQLLAATAGSETDQDVKNAAIAALGSHKGQIAMNSLRLALDDRNPATRDLAMQSLRHVTGKDFGNRPAEWLKAIPTQTIDAGTPPNQGPTIQLASGPTSPPIKQ